MPHTLQSSRADASCEHLGLWRPFVWPIGGRDILDAGPLLPGANHRRLGLRAALRQCLATPACWLSCIPGPAKMWNVSSPMS